MMSTESGSTGDATPDHVRLDFDASDPAHPGWVVSTARVIDPDRAAVVERLGSFSADDFGSARDLAEGVSRARGLPIVES